MISPGQQFISGYAEVRTNNPSGNLKNQMVAGIGLPTVDFAFGFTGTTLGWWPDDGGGGNQTVIADVNNNDGQFHTVGWEADLVNQTLTAFFDEFQVGQPQDVGCGGAFGNDSLIFGSGTVGGYDNTWDRVVF